MHRPGAEIGRQAWLRAMCPLGRVGSSPTLGTQSEMPLALAFLVAFDLTARLTFHTEQVHLDAATRITQLA